MARGKPRPAAAVEVPPPVMALVLHAEDRKDDVKLSTALQKLADEDPALAVSQSADGGEMTIAGTGRDAPARGARPHPQPLRRHGARGPRAGRLPRDDPRRIDGARTAQEAVGGHGQFGDCVLTVRPLERGEGVRFRETVTGGAVPRQYIPAWRRARGRP